MENHELIGLLTSQLEKEIKKVKRDSQILLDKYEVTDEASMLLVSALHETMEAFLEIRLLLGRYNHEDYQDTRVQMSAEQMKMILTSVGLLRATVEAAMVQQNIDEDACKASLHAIKCDTIDLYFDTDESIDLYQEYQLDKIARIN